MAEQRLSKLQKEIIRYIYLTEKEAKKFPEGSWGYYGILKTSKIEITHALKVDLKLPTRKELGLDHRNPIAKSKSFKMLRKTIALVESGVKIEDVHSATPNNPTLMNKEVSFRSFRNSIYRSIDNLAEKKLVFNFDKGWRKPYNLTEKGKRVASHLINVEFLGNPTLRNKGGESKWQKLNTDIQK